MLPWLQCRRVGRLLEAGRDADARHLVAQLEETAPGNRWTVEALNLVGLASPAQAAARLEPDGPVRVRQIGVLCPLSGRSAPGPLYCPSPGESPRSTGFGGRRRRAEVKAAA